MTETSPSPIAATSRSHGPIQGTSFLALLLFAICLPALAGPAIGEELNRVVLRVNNRIATLFDYEQRRSARLEAILAEASFSASERQSEVAEAGRKSLREMLDELLVLSRADQLRIEIGREQLEMSIESMQKRFGFETRAQFEQALTQSGLTMASYTDRMKRNMTTQEVMQREVQPRIKIDEEWMRRYYREHPEEFELPLRLHLEEIVVLESALPEAAGRQALAEEIRGRLSAGGSLAEVAAEHEAKGSTSGAIDLGWIQPGELAPELGAAVRDLQAGAVSQPVAARGGYHVLIVRERREPELRPFAEVQAEIEAKERERLFNQEIRGYLAELEAKAYIIAEPPAEAIGFRAAEVGGSETGLQAVPGAEMSPETESPAAAPPVLDPPVPEPPKPEPPGAGGALPPANSATPLPA